MSVINSISVAYPEGQTELLSGQQAIISVDVEVPASVITEATVTIETTDGASGTATILLSRPAPAVEVTATVTNGGGLIEPGATPNSFIYTAP